MEMLNKLTFADDQGLINVDEWQLQKHVSSLNRVCKEHDMWISISETNVMSVSRKQRSDSINISGT